jgi:hypothetical protein
LNLTLLSENLIVKLSVVNNKLFWVAFPIIFILINNTTNAQSIITNAQSSYIRLNSYDGIIANNVFGLKIYVRENNVSIPNWTLAARVNGQVKNEEGKVFDLSKMSIQINNISGEGLTLRKIGTNKKLVPLSENEFPIFKNSKAPIISTDNLKEFYISFNIIIEGGNYLEALKSWDQYQMDMAFFLRDEHNELISQSESSILMRITPQAD